LMNEFNSHPGGEAQRTEAEEILCENGSVAHIPLRLQPDIAVFGSGRVAACVRARGVAEKVLCTGGEDVRAVRAPIQSNTCVGAELVELLALDRIGRSRGARGERAKPAATLPAAEPCIVDGPGAEQKCPAGEVALPHQVEGLSVERKSIKVPGRGLALRVVVHGAGTRGEGQAARFAMFLLVNFGREHDA